MDDEAGDHKQRILRISRTGKPSYQYKGGGEGKIEMYYIFLQISCIWY